MTGTTTRSRRTEQGPLKEFVGGEVYVRYLYPKMSYGEQRDWDITHGVLTDVFDGGVMVGRDAFPFRERATIHFARPRNGGITDIWLSSGGASLYSNAWLKTVMRLGSKGTRRERIAAEEEIVKQIGRLRREEEADISSLQRDHKEHE